MVEMEYDDADDDDVEMHMTFGQSGDAGDDDGPINMVSSDFYKAHDLSRSLRRSRMPTSRAKRRARRNADGTGRERTRRMIRVHRSRQKRRTTV